MFSQTADMVPLSHRQAVPKRKGGDTVLVSLSLLIALALLLVPGAPGGPLDGTPLGALGRLMLVGLAILAGFTALFRVEGVPRWPVAVLGILLLAKLSACMLGQQAGWQGRYEVVDAAAPAQATFSSGFVTRPYRVDSAIDFDGPSFGLHFLNDTLPYASRYPQVPRDQAVPLRVTWTGTIFLARRRRLAISTACRGSVRVVIDGALQERVSDTPAQVQATAEPLGIGRHVVHIVYDKPAQVVPLVSVRLADASTGEILTPVPGVSNRPLSPIANEAGLATTGVVGIGAVVVLWLFLGIATGPGSLEPRLRGPRAGALAVFIAVCCLALLAYRTALPTLGQTVSLTSGDDWLAYESDARDVLHEGLLMPHGQPHGHGGAYFFYPFYSYALAGAHGLIGEDPSAGVLFNGLGIALLPLLLWTLGWHRLPSWAALSGTGAFVLFAWRCLIPYTRVLLTDNLFIVMVFAALVLLQRTLRNQRMSTGFASGVVCALAAATRPSFLTFLPLMVLVVLFVPHRYEWRGRLKLAAMAVGGMVAGLLPFTIRNVIMSGRLVVLVNSWLQLPYFLIPPGMANPVGLVHGRPPTLTESLSMAFDIVRSHPARTLGLEVQKLLFTLGFTQIGSVLHISHWEFVAVTACGVLALLLRALDRMTAILLGAFAFSHLVAMVMAAPWSYGYKSILPLITVWFFAAVFLLPHFWLWRRKLIR